MGVRMNRSGALAPIPIASTRIVKRLGHPCAAGGWTTSRMPARVTYHTVFARFPTNSLLSIAEATRTHKTKRSESDEMYSRYRGKQKIAQQMESMVRAETFRMEQVAEALLRLRLNHFHEIDAAWQYLLALRSPSRLKYCLPVFIILLSPKD